MIVMPIVIAIALFGWLGAVMWAGFHPRWKHHAQGPRTEVAGGAFQAVEGGRQLMPIPGHRSAPDDEIAAIVDAQNVDVPSARSPGEPERAGSAARASSASASARSTSTGRSDASEPGNNPTPLVASASRSCGALDPGAIWPLTLGSTFSPFLRCNLQQWEWSQVMRRRRPLQPATTRCQRPGH